MLRWCQSTLRTLDGHGRKYASTTGRLLPGVEALTKETHLFRRHSYYNNPNNLGHGDQSVNVSPQILSNPQSSGRTCVTSIHRNDNHELPLPAVGKTGGIDTEIPSMSGASISSQKCPENSLDTPPPSTFAPKNNGSAIAAFRASVARARRSQKGRQGLLDSLHKQYSTVQDTTDDPDLHLPYFDLLASFSKPEYLPQIVLGLCGVLERVRDPHPRFPAFLWDLLIVHGAEFDKEMKQRILQTAALRLDMNTRLQQTSFPSSVTSPGLTPEIIHQGVIGVSHVAAAFARTLFRCYNPHYPYPFLGHWATQQARHALAPQLALDVRWNNLKLLAVSLSPREVEVQYNPSLTGSHGTPTLLWRTALMLETLTRKLPRDKYGFGSQCGKVHDLVRPLWKTFSSAEIADQHADITRAYVSTFLRIAAKSFDERIKGECYRFSQQLGLWDHSSSDYKSSRAQAIDALAAYGTAHIACEGRDWGGLYSTISKVLPDLSWRTNVTNVLMRWYLLENLETAYDLYIHSLESGFDISQRVLAALLTELVNQQRWDITSMFLRHPSTTRENLELLLSRSLTIFQTERYRYVNPCYVRLLGHTALRTYAQQLPPRTLKYPIRYFLSLMVWTQNASGMVRLVDILCRTVPHFFTPRFMRGLVFDLVRRRDVPNALKLLQIFESIEGEGNSQPIQEIRRQLLFKFFKMGARKAASKLTRRKSRIDSLTKREALAHVAMSTLPSPVYYRHIQRIVSQANGDGATIREAVSLLLKAKRPWSARRLYTKSRSTLDTKASTILGNMIIHSPMLHKEFCHARLVRRVVRLMNVLITEYGFTPDRATLNIVIKALLRWKTMMDAPKIRRLFDNMVHEGYPVPNRFRQEENGVPFGSRHGPFSSLAISSLPKGMSFSRHVRPMYKMFIKAFYVRRDIEAAKTVVGILKEVEIAEMVELEKRSKARREGIIKKRMRDLKSKEVKLLKEKGAKGV